MRKQRVTRWAKERASFQKKQGGRREKKGGLVRKSTCFHFTSFPFSKIEIFFPQNLRWFETKSLLLRLIKHNLPFIPPHCGVHIAQSRGTFPDHPAQTLFDLLNLRDFALSRAIRTGQKALSLNMGVAFARQRLPFWFVRKQGGAKNTSHSASSKNCLLTTST